jgi:hypothetical protein
MIDTQAIRQRWDADGSKRDERGRRLFAASEVRAAGWGGLAAVSCVGADQLAALLGPATAAAGEDPRRPSVRLVANPTHDSGVVRLRLISGLGAEEAERRP